MLHVTATPAINCRSIEARSAPPVLAIAPPASCVRQAAHNTLSSCSVTHSRQKNRPHPGQRATASLPSWFQHRVCVTPCTFSRSMLGRARFRGRACRRSLSRGNRLTLMPESSKEHETGKAEDD